MSNLLCVDWDWFFPNPLEAGDTGNSDWSLYDWGHAETPLFLSTMIWQTRAAPFFQRGLDLPGVQVPTGGWQGFWGRFSFAEDVWFGYGDSNAHAGLVAPPDGESAFESVVLFDAHHDCGYGITSYEEFLAQETFSCEDWMLEQQRHGCTDLEVRFPQWKPRGVTEKLPSGARARLRVDDGGPVNGPVFDAVFVCRSGAWVPAWCDQDFAQFVQAAPFEGTQVDAVALERDWDEGPARAMADQWHQVMDSLPVAQGVDAEE